MVDTEVTRRITKNYLLLVGIYISSTDVAKYFKFGTLFGQCLSVESSIDINSNGLVQSLHKINRSGTIDDHIQRSSEEFKIRGGEAQVLFHLERGEAGRDLQCHRGWGLFSIYTIPRSQGSRLCIFQNI